MKLAIGLATMMVVAAAGAAQALQHGEGVPGIGSGAVHDAKAVGVICFSDDSTGASCTVLQAVADAKAAGGLDFVEIYNNDPGPHAVADAKVAGDGGNWPPPPAAVSDAKAAGLDG